jgi:hypothetical protein
VRTGEPNRSASMTVTALRQHRCIYRLVLKGAAVTAFGP